MYSIIRIIIFKKISPLSLPDTFKRIINIPLRIFMTLYLKAISLMGITKKLIFIHGGIKNTIVKSLKILLSNKPSVLIKKIFSQYEKANNANKLFDWQKLKEANFAIDVNIDCLKHKKNRHKESLLFLAYAVDGKIKFHVQKLIDSFSNKEINIILIVNTDKFYKPEKLILDSVDSLYVRENKGYDFGAWAHVLRIDKTLFNQDGLYLINDSIYGPTSIDEFDKLIERIRGSQADFIGLTSNKQISYHVQSYFTVIKKNILVNFTFQDFIFKVQNFISVDDVIKNYEIPLLSLIENSGFKAEVLFDRLNDKDPTVFYWQNLLDSGFPFFKIKLLRDSFHMHLSRDWESILSRHGVPKKDIRSLKDINNNLPGGKYQPYSITRSLEKQRKTRITYIAPWPYESGLGFACRQCISALMNLDVEVNYICPSAPFSNHYRNSNYNVSSFVGPSDIVIIQFNPDSWDYFFDKNIWDIINNSKIKIGSFVWESQILPKTFIDAFKKLDLIWVPSKYVESSFKLFTDKPIYIIPYIISKPDTPSAPSIKLLQKTYNLNKDKKIFLFIFDSSSFFKRKNPLALLKAFNMSELAKKGYQLVFKSKNLTLTDPETLNFISQCNKSKGVVMIDQLMNNQEINGLYHSSSFYVSPHSSEGFGLSIAEAMLCGLIVIATDFGGSKDFLNNKCGFPVKYNLVTLKKKYGPYLKGSIWADISVDDLSRNLQLAASLSKSDYAGMSHQAIIKINKKLSLTNVSKHMNKTIKNFITMSNYE